MGRIAVFVVLSLLPTGWGQELVRRNGTVSPGAISWLPAGKFAIAGEVGGSVDDLHAIRWPGGSRPNHTANVHLVFQLGDGQRLSGHIASVDDRTIRLVSPYLGPVTVPRAMVDSINHPEGRKPRQVLTPATKQLLGEPRWLQHRLMLDQAGQGAELLLSTKLERGQVQLGYELMRGGVLTLTLGDLDGTVVLDGGKRHARATFGNKAGTIDITERGTLSVRFGSEGIDVLALGQSLAFEQQAPAVTKVRVERTSADGQVTCTSLRVDELVPIRPVPASPTSDNDTICMRDGACWHGNWVGTAGDDWTLRSARGERSLTSADWLAIHLTRGKRPQRTLDGEHVIMHVQVEPGITDVIAGVVRRFDERQWLIEHESLGELTIPVLMLQQVRPVFYGARQAIESMPHLIADRSIAGLSNRERTARKLVRPVMWKRVENESIDILVEVGVVAGATMEVRLNNVDLGTIAPRPGHDVAWRRFAVPLDQLIGTQYELTLHMPAGHADVRSIRLEQRRPR